jgi:tetratricopeptide (TPR) repeat protein
MTTHIFLGLGMWPLVVSQNVIASGSDSSRWQASHATAWLLYGYLQQGRYEAARQLIASLAAHGVGRPPTRGPLANFRARYVIESERWDSPEARALDADLGVAGEDDYEYATFASGFAAAKRGDRTRANEMLQLLAKRNGNALQSLKPGAAGPQSVPVILELSLRAALARQDGKIDSAVALLRRATALEDAMPSEFGPPAALAPSHEALGAILLAANRSKEAADEYERALQLQPGRAAALLGSSRAEAARGRTDAADRAYRTLVDNWRDADADVRSALRPR